MTEETIKNHKILWDSMIKELESRDELYTHDNAGRIKNLVFYKLFPSYIKGHCWLRHENHKYGKRTLECNCPMLIDNECKLWYDFCKSINNKDLHKSIKIAKEIKDIA